jgi:hypothetical protein
MTTRPAAAIGGNSAGIPHVAPVAQSQIGRGRGRHLLLYRKRFARQRRLLNLEVDRFQQANVGRNLVAGV